MVSEAVPRHQLSRDGTRQAIGRIWREVLRLEDFGADDNFFELGGHSLTASQVIARVARTLHVEITMAEFFEWPTVDGLTNLVVRRGAPEGGTPE